MGNVKAEGLKTDVVVVGSGAAGAMVAQEIARSGHDVIVIERGRDMTTFAGMSERDLARLLYQSEGKYPKTKEGYSLLRGINSGGSTVLAVGHGVRCLSDEFRALGIDLTEAFRETEADMGLCDMPDEHIGPNSRRLIHAAKSLDLKIGTWPKFIDFGSCTHCGRCVLSCPHGAKWSSNDVLDTIRPMENVRILTETRVTFVKISDGRATGVMCETADGSFEVRADKTILCAGGLGTPVILQNSGIDAGNALFMDVFRVVYGRSSQFAAVNEPAMTAVFETHDRAGYLLTPYVDISLYFQGIAGWFGDLSPYGIMIKIKDDNHGRVDRDGNVSKSLTEKDRQRLSDGVALAGKILVEAGASAESITVSEPAGGHIGGSAAIGDVVDSSLECRSAKHLYVCDASVFPESPGLPPILTICALGKWLGKRLASSLGAI